MDTAKVVQDTLQAAKQTIAQPNHGQYEWLELIIKSNPGIVTTVLTLTLSGLLLPIGLVWVNARSSRKLKELEKDLEMKYKDKDDIRTQEKIVYSSLSKVLFDVQQLHVALSGTCIDENCISNALQKFDSSINKYHEEISNNMLFLSSEVINLIYKFYKDIGELKIELAELNKSKTFDMAHVAVYYKATELAETIIVIQEKFLVNKSDLVIAFDKTQQEMMKYCCGKKPPEDLEKKYKELKAKLIPDLC